MCIISQATENTADSDPATSPNTGTSWSTWIPSKLSFAMAAHPQLPEPTVFGPFEINAAAGELRESGIRIRLSAQPMRILLALLARRGELVTREQLREEVWGGTTYVDFDHGLNTAINKLRRALDDSAEKPRFIETVPGRGYRFVGLLERPDASAIPAIEESIDRSEPTTRRNLRHGWWLAALVACLIVFSVWRWRPTSLRPQAAWKLTRITNDVGLSDTAALSPDGKMVAYSSDRSPEGDRDLYVQQVAGGQPIRLTFDGANNTTPNFSPDGGRIVFRSNRDGGGIYEISSFGGEVRLLAKDGFDPRFSPDGSRVAYWVGGEDIAQSVPGGGALWVVSATGGQPTRVGRNLTNARYPIWSPDGDHLLTVGYNSAKAYERSAIDWWLVPTNGEEAVRTGAYQKLGGAGIQERDQAVSQSRPIPTPGIPRPVCWLTADNSIIFSAPAQNGDTQNLWKGAISSHSGELNGTFTRLTTGAGNEVSSSCASVDMLAFTDLKPGRAIWTLPADLESGVAKGSISGLTSALPCRAPRSRTTDAISHSLPINRGD
jgi:DNA-binding winged helix-turn-helix (wHTH) protein